MHIFLTAQPYLFVPFFIYCSRQGPAAHRNIFVSCSDLSSIALQIKVEHSKGKYKVDTHALHHALALNYNPAQGHPQATSSPTKPIMTGRPKRHTKRTEKYQNHRKRETKRGSGKNRHRSRECALTHALHAFNQ